MTTRHRVALPFVTGVITAVLILAAYYSAAWGADGAAAPVTESGLAEWWQTGALAAPLAACAFGLLMLIDRVAPERWRWVAWLRRGRTRAWASLAIGNLSAMLPAIADGSVTWGGLSIALLGGLLAIEPGQKRRDEASGEIEAGEEGAPT